MSKMEKIKRVLTTDDRKIIKSIKAQTVGMVEALPLQGFIQNLFLRHIRTETIRHLSKDGLKLIGGSDKQFNFNDAKREVDEAMVQLTPEGLMVEAVNFRAIGDGKILQRVSDLLTWIVDHKEQILQVIKVIMSLIALFGTTS